MKDLLGIYYPAMTLIFKLTSVFISLSACESRFGVLSLITLLLSIGLSFPFFINQMIFIAMWLAVIVALACVGEACFLVRERFFFILILNKVSFPSLFI